MCMTIVLVGMLHLGQCDVIKVGPVLGKIVVLLDELGSTFDLSFRVDRIIVGLTFLVVVAVAVIRVCLVNRPVASSPVVAGVA